VALHRDPDEPGGRPRWVLARDRVPGSTINRVLVVGAILVVVILFLWALTSGHLHPFGGSHKTPSSTASSTKTAPAAGGSAPATFAPVKDGDLQLQVQSIRTDARDKLVVTLKVDNTTSSFVSFYGENQLLHSTDHRTSRGAVALTTLEPHEVAGVAVVFGIPSGFQASSIELHAAPGSHGVDVKLS
jgi:hypothetical protein